MMIRRKKQFIAGAICPNCADIDSLVLYTDNQTIECANCNYTRTSEQRDQESNKAQFVSVETTDQKTLGKRVKNIKVDDTNLINITEVDE